jgi:hypothetical protein
MTDADKFGRLEDVQLRSAWAHEALEFTPWLAQNLDRLGEVLGLELELAGQEVAVENFSADILARSVRDDTMVLIENQFQQSDHSHLGQIMTYLAGLQASTVVWIAPKFREAHLSAIRWLNEHTEEPFAFFAVELRVVRIGQSPMVPLFEVIERPNNWDRQLQEIAKPSSEPTSLAAFRSRFWTRLLERHPTEAKNGDANAASSRWRVLPELDLVVVQYISQNNVGVFIRGRRGVGPEAVAERLSPHYETLHERLGVVFQEGREKTYFFVKSLKLDTNDEANWDRAVDWLKAEADRYEAALIDVLGGKD